MPLLPMLPPSLAGLANPRVFALVITTWFPFLTFFVFATGAVRVLRAVGAVLGWVWASLRPGRNLRTYGAHAGAWAVVTGATDGIGREFALQLAQRGFGVALVSRTPAKLAAVQAEIESLTPGARTVVHAIDFETAGDAEYTALTESLGRLDIGLLVNNVGRSHDSPVDFADTPLRELDAILTVNARATLRVTHALLPALRAHAAGTRGARALVLTLGSFTSIPTPMLATYSGTKALLATWSGALAAEEAPRRVDVQLANTYFVVSAMSKLRAPTLFVPTARAYVKGALAHAGRGDCAPYWSHAFLALAIDQLDARGLFTRLAHRLHKDIRVRVLRKRAREAAAEKKAL